MSNHRTTSQADDATMMRAIMNGDTETVRTPLGGDANAKVRAKKGLTALMWAAGNGHTEIVQPLLAASDGG